MLNGGTINNLNKVAACVQINNGSIASYTSDDATLTGGNERLKAVLLNTDTPSCAQLNRALTDSPYNFLAGNANVAVGTQLFATDALGFCTIPLVPKLANGLVANNSYGYSNINSVNAGTQTICIPLSVLHPFFDSDTMIPLSICNQIVIEIFWASPQQAFCSDITSAAGTAAANGTAPVSGPLVGITSYQIKNLKISCDLVTCADEINDLYKLKAASSEGLIMPYDDYAMSTKSMTWSSGASQVHQAILSTANLKSMIMFRQSNAVANGQNAWSNSNYMYSGIQGYTTTINNSNLPQNPLNTQNAMLAFNMRSRSSTNNQLSNCLANNSYVFGKCETVATPLTNAAAGNITANYTSIAPAGLCSFMIYNNYEKIHEDIDVGNGLNLQSSGSMLSVKYLEDQGGAGDPAGLKAAQFGPYTLYLLMRYGKALVFADGAIQVRG